MRVVQRMAFAISLITIMTGCSNSAPAPSYQKHLRRFKTSDADLIDVDPTRAADIERQGATWVAKSDIRTRPFCDNRNRFIVVANKPG